MYFVVGLGNPGPPYDGTRHNVGFETVRLLARQHHGDAWRRFKDSEVCRLTVAGEDILLLQPQTFMNRSGEPVGAAARFYKVAPAAIIVVHDELDFDPGQVRLKVGGGAGGHNGLRSLISHLGADFVRVRLGIGKPPAAQGAAYVLSRFDPASRRQLDDALITASLAVEAVIKEGAAAAMNRFNRV